SRACRSLCSSFLLVAVGHCASLEVEGFCEGLRLLFAQTLCDTTEPRPVRVGRRDLHPYRVRLHASPLDIFVLNFCWMKWFSALIHAISAGLRTDTRSRPSKTCTSTLRGPGQTSPPEFPRPLP